MTYNALLICSVSRSDFYLVDMFENSFSAKGFNYFTVGKNPSIDIDLDFIKKSIELCNIIVIVITNQKYLTIIRQILEDNLIILNLKRRPVIVVSSPELINILKEKSTFSVIVDKLHQYEMEDISPQIEQLVLKIKDIVDKRELQKSLGALGLILGGIGIGAGLLFYLFKDEDEGDE